MSRHRERAREPPRVVSESDPRFQIAAARRILHREGLDSQVGGHVSLRVPGEDAFLVTPVPVLRRDAARARQQGRLRPAGDRAGHAARVAGINFHASIYAARPDVNCVIHTHAKNMSVLSTTGVPFGMYYDYASLLLDEVVPWVDDPNLVPSEEGELMVEALGGRKALLMGHHGSLHVGDTLERVTMEALVMELCAGYQLAAMAVGGKPLDRGPRESYRNAYLENAFREQMWLANYRRLLRSDPDLFATLQRSATGRRRRSGCPPAHVADLRDAARRRLPRMVFDFVDGGAEDEVDAAATTGGPSPAWPSARACWSTSRERPQAVRCSAGTCACR